MLKLESFYRTEDDIYYVKDYDVSLNRYLIATPSKWKSERIPAKLEHTLTFLQHKKFLNANDIHEYMQKTYPEYCI